MVQQVQELPDDNEADAPDESSEETKVSNALNIHTNQDIFFQKNGMLRLPTCMQAIDAKIRQWSVGKKGNIRSLLSTLQYVISNLRQVI